MRTKMVICGVVFLSLLLQCSLMPAISIASVTPNLMIVLVVSFGLMRGKRSGMLLGFLCGFRAFIYMFIGYLCGYCYRIFYDDDVKMPALLTAGADLAYGILVYGTQFLLRGRINFFFYLKRIILPEMIYTILLTLILYRLLLLLNRKLDQMDKRGVDSFV